VDFAHSSSFRRIAVLFIALVGLVMFSAQASAQPFEPTTTTLQASPTSATVGQQVVLTATVSCPGFAPGGLGVTFFDGSELLDTIPVDANGQASLTTSFTTEGPHTITAAYNGDQNCGASNTTATVNVSAEPTPPKPEPCGCGLINLNFFSNNTIGRQAA
jgi:hypothetical protein